MTGGMTEARITVDGVVLTDAQAITLRVAVSHFVSLLSDPVERAALGEIGPLYQARASELETMLVEAASSPARLEARRRH